MKEGNWLWLLRVWGIRERLLNLESFVFWVETRMRRYCLNFRFFLTISKCACKKNIVCQFKQIHQIINLTGELNKIGHTYFHRIECIFQSIIPLISSLSYLTDQIKMIFNMVKIPYFILFIVTLNIYHKHQRRMCFFIL